MKEIRSIIHAYAGIDFNTHRAALATVVRVEGSSYRRMGARMLVLDSGEYVGGISGGCLEGDALRKAQRAIMNNSPSVVTYDTTKDDEHQIGVGLGCNGVIDVLFTPVSPDDPDNPIQLLAAVSDTRTQRAVVTVTGSPNAAILGKMFLYGGSEPGAVLPGIQQGRLAADIQSCLNSRTSAHTAYETPEGQLTLFIEVVMPEIRLFLYGGNYDVLPLIRISKELGWEVTVVTSLAKASKSLFELADAVKEQKLQEELTIDDHTAIVLMAHDLKTDEKNLARVRESRAFYIGMLGPAKRGRKIIDKLESNGIVITGACRNRIFTPAGLDIGANTPEEIALSITAEIKSCIAGRQGASLRLRDRAIHDS